MWVLDAIFNKISVGETQEPKKKKKNTNLTQSVEYDIAIVCTCNLETILK